MKTEAAGGYTGPFAPFEWLLASRILRAQSKNGWASIISIFAVLGILLGVAALIIVQSLFNGFRKELIAKLYGLNGHVIVRPFFGPFNDYDAVAGRLKAVPGVTQALAVIEGKALIASQTTTEGIIVRGLKEDDLKALTAISEKVNYGTLDGLDGSTGIVMGTRLANTLNVSVGSVVTLLAPRGASTAFGTTPRQKQFTVKAIFEIGQSDYDNTVAFLPLKQAQTFFNLRHRTYRYRIPIGAVHVLEVLVADPENVRDLRPSLQAAAGDAMLLSDWRQRNESLTSLLAVQRNVSYIVVMLIVIVAVMNIISGLIMLVKNKRRDIAVLRTMGATRGSIMRVFFISGTSIGFAGTLLGVIFELAGAYYADDIQKFLSWVFDVQLFPAQFYFLSKLPAELDPWQIAPVVVFSLLLSMLGMIFPALAAASLDPVEALRYE